MFFSLLKFYRNQFYISRKGENTQTTASVHGKMDFATKFYSKFGLSHPSFFFLPEKSSGKGYEENKQMAGDVKKSRYSGGLVKFGQIITKFRRPSAIAHFFCDF